MTKRHSIAALSHLLAAALLISAPFASHAERKKPKTPLGEQMEKISKNLKALGKQVGDDTQRASSMECIAAVLEAARKARTLVPAKAQKIPESERPEFVSAFQKKLDELIARLEKVESAIRDGKTAEAQTLLGDLKKIKRDGHEKFAVEEDD
jgi:soluble cytochrome b562